jgi:hypothetical protein
MIFLSVIITNKFEDIKRAIEKDRQFNGYKKNLFVIITDKKIILWKPTMKMQNFVYALISNCCNMYIFYVGYNGKIVISTTNKGVLSFFVFLCVCKIKWKKNS